MQCTVIRKQSTNAAARFGARGKVSYSALWREKWQFEASAQSSFLPAAEPCNRPLDDQSDGGAGAGSQCLADDGMVESCINLP